MLAVRSTRPERSFTPIIPLRKETQHYSEKATTITKMAAINPEILKLMAAFELK